jgi:putative ABC transport system substrate-binding protein
MRRREFITLLGGVAAFCSLDQSAEASAPVIGFLSSLSADENAAAFGSGVADAGFADNGTVAFEYRYAAGDYARLPEMANELVSRNVSVIAALAPPAARAAKAATAAIPIVFVVGFDPVRIGLVESFNRPGGNATGVCLITSPLGQKRVELILELAPNARSMAMLVNPTNPDTKTEIEDARAAAAAKGRELRIVNASTAAEIDLAFTQNAGNGLDALMVDSDPFFVIQREQITALAARHRVPGIYPFRQFTAANGLISYGASLSDAYRQAGRYAGRILKGQHPTDLPVLQPTVFELVLNLRVAKELGITVSPSLQARADEVLE